MNINTLPYRNSNVVSMCNEIRTLPNNSSLILQNKHFSRSMNKSLPPPPPPPHFNPSSPLYSPTGPFSITRTQFNTCPLHRTSNKRRQSAQMCQSDIWVKQGAKVVESKRGNKRSFKFG